ncbi:MAG: hypothetical protein ACP5MX_01685 [Candidatus Micrarchaeia archaeon]
MLANNAFVEYIHTNVGRYGVEVMKRLAVPKTDDALANELSVKVNEVRRVLNLLSGYGITKYDTEKDSKGWLTFNWYVDVDKLLEFNSGISENKKDVFWLLLKLKPKARPKPKPEAFGPPAQASAPAPRLCRLSRY